MTLTTIILWDQVLPIALLGLILLPGGPGFLSRRRGRIKVPSLRVIFPLVNKVWLF
jgi:hypothetical protein